MEGNISFAQRMVREYFPPLHGDAALTTPTTVRGCDVGGGAGPASTTGPGPEPAPALSATERFIVEAILAEIAEPFGADQVRPGDRIADFVVTSVVLPVLARAFSDYTGARIRLVDCAMYPTVQELGQFLDQKRREASVQAYQCVTLVRPSRSQSRPALFMVHDGLGRTHQYVTDCVTDQHPLALVQPYWDAADAPLITSLDEVAALYVAMIRAKQAQGPWRLGGYSLGAMLAWRMAQLLGDVDRLILIDCPNVPPLSKAEAVADRAVISALQEQFSEMAAFRHSAVLTSQIADRPILTGTRTQPTLVVAGSLGIVQKMNLADTDDIRQSWERAIGPQLSFVCIQGASHLDIMLPPFTNQVHAAIEQFLQ